jgi:hypothetical protein
MSEAAPTGDGQAGTDDWSPAESAANQRDRLTPPAQQAIAKTCRRCGVTFPSGNQLHKHLRECPQRKQKRPLDAPATAPAPTPQAELPAAAPASSGEAAAAAVATGEPEGTVFDESASRERAGKRQRQAAPAPASTPLRVSLQELTELPRAAASAEGGATKDGGAEATQADDEVQAAEAVVETEGDSSEQGFARLSGALCRWRHLCTARHELGNPSSPQMPGHGLPRDCVLAGHASRGCVNAFCKCCKEQPDEDRAIERALFALGANLGAQELGCARRPLMEAAATFVRAVQPLFEGAAGEALRGAVNRERGRHRAANACSEAEADEAAPQDAEAAQHAAEDYWFAEAAPLNAEAAQQSEDWWLSEAAPLDAEAAQQHMQQQQMQHHMRQIQQAQTPADQEFHQQWGAYYAAALAQQKQQQP